MNRALPKVSVVTITYGHEKYIMETLDGVLMQQYEGPVEFIIANDNSPDNTDEVLRQYIETHHVPNNFEIKYTKHDTNKGMMPNFFWALEQATGKYIALCEGDDYWTDPLKLQRQVDFLKENNNYSLVAENSNVIDERHELEYLFTQKELSYDLNIQDLIKGRRFHTGSVLFRKDFFKAPKNISEFPFGDTLLFVVLAQQGKIKFLPNISSVYRRNQGGVSTGANRFEWAKKVENFNILLNECLNGEFSTLHNRNIALNYYSALKWAIKNMDISAAVISGYRYLKYKLKR